MTTAKLERAIYMLTIGSALGWLQTAGVAVGGRWFNPSVAMGALIPIALAGLLIVTRSARLAAGWLRDRRVRQTGAA
jgi:hypothetical protein